MRHLPSRTLARRALLTTAALAALTLPAGAATAAPATYTDPGGSGASVTIDKTTIAPGEWLEITGRGFVGGSGSGDPLVTLRPYDIDRGPAWTAGGADHHTAQGPWSSEAAHWFKTTQPAGTFSARMRLPVDAKVDGPDPGGLAGNHWLRVLSGAFFTSTGTRVTQPITYVAPFKVVDNVTLGLTFAGGPSPIFEAGRSFRPGAVLTVRGRGFTPEQPLSVQLDGTPITGATITTDAEGATPANTTVTLPAGVTVGRHVLRLATGAVAHEAPITVTSVPSRTLSTPAVRPGGTIAVTVRDYVGVDGAGQKVGVVIGSRVLGCLTTDAAGNARGTATLPPETPAGTVNLLFNAGTSCVPPPQGGVVDDQPISSQGTPLQVAPGAPALSAPGGTAGQTIAVSGSGFAPGAAAAAEYRGEARPSALTVDAAGVLSGTVTLPDGVGGGTLLVSAGGTVAAAEVAVAAAPAVVPAPPAVLPAVPSVVPPAAAPTTPVRPAPITAGRVASLKALKGGRRLSLVVRGGSAVSTAVTVRSRSRLRTTRTGRARILTLARRTVGRAGTYRLTLTRDGRAALRRNRTVQVVVTVAPKGGTATRTTLRLRRT